MTSTLIRPVADLIRPAPQSRWSAWRARVRETNDRLARAEASVPSRLDALDRRVLVSA